VRQFLAESYCLPLLAHGTQLPLRCNLRVQLTCVLAMWYSDDTAFDRQALNGRVFWDHEYGSTELPGYKSHAP
jgi:hypothetical protein